MAVDSNSKPNVPEVFKEIIKSDTEKSEIHALGYGMSQANWKRLKELRLDRMNLVRGAEELLHWNKDKGNKP
jgi:hypothetical protein